MVAPKFTGRYCADYNGRRGVLHESARLRLKRFVAYKLDVKVAVELMQLVDNG